jgi:uncharacterized protein
VPFGPDPTVAVERAVMEMHWDQLTFLHWPMDPEVVQATLPPGLRVQTFGGTAWISLVPFVMRITLPHAPVVPWLGRFPETNVRTYVTADAHSSNGSRHDEPHATEGIWFYSLDASRAAAVAFARATYRLPYIWSAMSVERAHDTIVYRCRRHTGGRASSDVAVRIGARYRPDELTELDHFLSARWRLYSVVAGRTVAALARHEPWPLRRAELLHLADGLVVADGLPEPLGPPIVQFADTVAVRVGAPHRVR